MPRSTRKLAAPAGLVTVLLAGWCGTALAAEPGTGPQLASAATQAAMAANAPDHDDESDYVWNDAQVAPIALNGASATSASPNVTVSGGLVTITASGTYELTGTLSNGQIAVNSPDDGIVRLILNGATISNSTSSAIQVADAGEVMVVLEAGTTNRLSDASQYVYPDPAVDEPNAALFSTADLTITGTGTLNVQGNAFDGIASKDGLVIDSGTVVVNAVDDGIRGKNYVVVNGGTSTVTSRGDGIKSDEDTDATMGYVSITAGTVNVTSTGDGIDGATDVVVSGGTITVRSGGGAGATIGADASAKGLKAGVSAVIGGGQITLDSADDGVNTNAIVTIDGGTLTVASRDDAVKSNSDINISAGTVTVTRSNEGLESLRVTISGGTTNLTASDDAVNSVEEGVDEFANSQNAYTTISGGTVVVNSAIDGIDTNGVVNLTGGTVVISGPATGSPGEGAIDANGPVNFRGGVVMGAGSTSMAVLAVPPTNAQGWVAPRFSSMQGPNTIVHIVSNGQVLASYRSPKTFQEVVFSSNRITNGQTYQVYTGGSVSGTSVGGMYTSGSIAGAQQVATATAGQYSGGLVGWPGGGFPGGGTAFPMD